MKKFLIIWVGELVSSIGSGMTAFAVSIYVYQVTGRATLVSLAALLAFLPSVLLSPVGGVLADRYDRRLMMILGDLLSVSGVFCILFFTALPFVNTCVDVMLRVNIPNEVQGRAWGMISVLSQSGFILAYAVVGVLADFVFGPMMMEGGILAGSVGRIIGTGEGRGIGLMLILAGLLMVGVALLFGSHKNIQRIERGAAIELVNN